MRLSNMFRSNRITNHHGMTLVEIMIVLAIIGSMMALLLPRLTGSQDKAKVKEAKIHMGQVINALSFYYSDCGKYPQSIQGLTQQDTSCSNWGPEAYMKSRNENGEITDPWGTPYVYELNGAQFVLKSLGKDKADGGTGYNADISSEDL